MPERGILFLITLCGYFFNVIPTKVGIQACWFFEIETWIPAFAGMTEMRKQ
jgi:hypothetical protein